MCHTNLHEKRFAGIVLLDDVHRLVGKESGGVLACCAVLRHRTSFSAVGRLVTAHVKASMRVCVVVLTSSIEAEIRVETSEHRKAISRITMDLLHLIYIIQLSKYPRR